jgi:hypothetical protein
MLFFYLLLLIFPGCFFPANQKVARLSATFRVADGYISCG